MLSNHIFFLTKCDLFALSTSPLLLLDKLKFDECQLYSSKSLLSLLCSYFDHLYGASISSCLRFSLVSIWSFDSSKLVIISEFAWLDCLILQLTRCLHGFTMNMMTKIIQSLPLPADQSLIKHSRIETVQSLISHFVSRTHFLLSVGSSTITDIYLSYFPSEAIFSYSNEHYILLILEHEYGKQLCVALSNDTTKSAKQKHIRREKKINAAISAQKTSLELQSSWPTIVSNQTIFSCLA